MSMLRVARVRVDVLQAQSMHVEAPLFCPHWTSQTRALSLSGRALKKLYGDAMILQCAM